MSGPAWEKTAIRSPGTPDSYPRWNFAPFRSMPHDADFAARRLIGENDHLIRLNA